jgi:hypothetical protein
MKTFKLKDKVRLNPANYSKAGYEVDIYQNIEFEVHYIHKPGTFHYYKEDLINKGLYTREELSRKEVYNLGCQLYVGERPFRHGVYESHEIAAIDDDMILVESHVPTPINAPKAIIDDILKAYALFHAQCNLETNRGDILNDIQKGKINKKTMLDIIEDVDALPCCDSLYDVYMTKEANKWMNDNEDFSIKEYLACYELSLIPHSG